MGLTQGWGTFPGRRESKLEPPKSHPHPFLGGGGLQPPVDPGVPPTSHFSRRLSPLCVAEELGVQPRPPAGQPKGGCRPGPAPLPPKSSSPLFTDDRREPWLLERNPGRPGFASSSSRLPGTLPTSALPVQVSHGRLRPCQARLRSPGSRDRREGPSARPQQAPHQGFPLAVTRRPGRSAWDILPTSSSMRAGNSELSTFANCTLLWSGFLTRTPIPPKPSTLYSSEQPAQDPVNDRFLSRSCTGQQHPQDKKRKRI